MALKICGRVLVGIVGLLAASCAPSLSEVARETPSLSEVAQETAFRDVTASAFSPAPKAVGWPALALFDYDNDGDIDLFVTSITGTPNLLYDNDGRGGFTEVADLAGVRFTGDWGVCTGVGDFDNDGWLDLIIGRQLPDAPDDPRATVRYLKNLGPDKFGQVRFADATEETGLSSVNFGSSIGVADIDNDGLLDLYIARYNFGDLIFEENQTFLPDTPNVLLRNTGIVAGGVPLFEDITESAGVAGTLVGGLAPSTANILHHMPTWSVYFTDVNRDGFQDLFALQEIPGGVDLFLGNGDLTFTRSQEALLNKHGGWMGIAAADYDRDGDLDYFLGNVGADARGAGVETNHLTSAWRRENGTPFHRLLENDGNGVFVDAAGDASVTPGTLPPTNQHQGRGLQAYEFSFGCAWLDLQNDGWPDLAWTGDLILTDGLEGRFRQDFHGVGRLLRNDGGQSFTDRTGARGFFNWTGDQPVAFGHSRAGRALAAVDFTGDGFDDICRTNQNEDDTLQCLINPAVEDAHWVTVRLKGTDSNAFGIGARVEATAGGVDYVGEVVTTTSAFTAVQPQVHFGLGETTIIDRLTVHWPSGSTTERQAVAVDRVLTIAE
ncbi:MAG: CRTAC1 family protein [Phycisphaerae bacterium]